MHVALAREALPASFAAVTPRADDSAPDGVPVAPLATAPFDDEEGEERTVATPGIVPIPTAEELGLTQPVSKR